MKARIPAALVLCVLLLGGCARVLAVIKSEAGLSMPSAPFSAPEDYRSPPEVEPGEILHNGYLGLRVAIPEECYDYSASYYLETLDESALTPLPEDSADPSLYNWYEDDAGSYLTLVGISFFVEESWDYAGYSAGLDWYPGLSRREYLSLVEQEITAEEEYASREIVARDSAPAENGGEYLRYVVRVRDLEEPEHVYLEEHFVLPVKDMYLRLFITYPEGSGEARVKTQKLLEEVCAVQQTGQAI